MVRRCWLISVRDHVEKLSPVHRFSAKFHMVKNFKKHCSTDDLNSPIVPNGAERGIPFCLCMGVQESASGQIDSSLDVFTVCGCACLRIGVVVKTLVSFGAKAIESCYSEGIK